MKKVNRGKMRIQGIEPWSVPWEGTMIPLHQMRFCLLDQCNFIFVSGEAYVVVLSVVNQNLYFIYVTTSQR